MNLVVVESPTKARTISKYLGKDYEIKASMGHIMDLPKSKLGVDVEHDFKPQFEDVPGKKDVVAELKKAAKGADTIILATDPDREGEAIAAHVKEVLSSDGNKFKRIVFHEITENAVNEALKNPRDLDKNLVDAQTARRVLDRLVGYKLSPILWKKVRRGLSAGRVQSVALRLIVEREREIEKFKKEKYFTISVVLKGIDFELIEINGEKLEQQEKFSLYDGEYRVTKSSITDQARVQDLVSDIKNSEFTISEVAKKESRRFPSPPFTTSTLQIDASRRFGFSGKRTMSLAQKLYEEGYITYHRTDSVVIGKGAMFAIREYVEKEFGKKYIPEQPRFYKTKSKVAQEAHEAIRPTHLGNSQEKIREHLGRDFAKIYDLIWRRAIASQMAEAVLEGTSVTADSDSKYKAKANGSILIFDGFLKINPQALSDTVLPDFVQNEKLKPEIVKPLEHETLPPPRYNDASLISTLEEKGIGRPSTYASIIEVIASRMYVERAEGRFVPTNVGVAVNDFLVKNFSTIDDIPFTAKMEDQLDMIANGQEQWVPVIKTFYEPFSTTLEKVEGAERVKIEVEKTDEKCPECGSPLVVRIGRFGKFLACSTFPNCKFTKPFVEETNLTCPKDGGKIILKKTRKGRRFYGCSNYPKCDFAAWKIEDIKKAGQEKQEEKPQKSA
jgi:DNA topoisomerase I